MQQRYYDRSSSARWFPKPILCSTTLFPVLTAASEPAKTAGPGCDNCTTYLKYFGYYVMNSKRWGRKLGLVPESRQISTDSCEVVALARSYGS